MVKPTSDPAKPDGPVSARDAALRLIAAVEDGAPLADCAERMLSPLAPADRARALRLATETFRWGPRCDQVLGPYLRNKPYPNIHAILRMGVYEMLGDDQAAHGVVNDAVNLARHRQPSAAGLVNAVLRRVSKAEIDWNGLPAPRLPKWLRKPLNAAYGKKALEAIERAHAVGAPLDLTPKDGNAERLAKLVGGDALPSGTVRIAGRAQVSDLPEFDAGTWWVQDAAAAIPARLLDAKPGEAVLDLCAAPGGKTMQLAAAGADVTAVDISEGRLKRLGENLKRTDLNANVVTADLLKWEPELQADAILLDAPCSATGTIRRHPDLPYAKDGTGLDELIALQAQLLDRAWGWLKPVGRLVFCTCSLLPDEGEAQLESALRRLPNASVDAIDPVAFGLAQEWLDDLGGLRLRPDYRAEHGGLDGFYISLLRKTA